MRVVVVAEYYPRRADPVLGVWAHRQALAARDAGADVRVLVLHRPIPSKAALRARDHRAIGRLLRQPRHALIDGLEVTYVPFVAPPRSRTYGSWGAWAAPTLGRALRRLRAEWPFDLVHAHYAVPATDAVRRALPAVPVVLSEHGGDVLWTVEQGPRARAAVERAFAHARVVLANSADTARRCRAHGAGDVRVVHLGTELPATLAERPATPTLVTVGHLVARKRHVDVVRAVARLRDRWPQLRYAIVGDGPERAAIEALARELGVAERVELCGELPHAEAVAVAQAGTLFVLPSIDEAFGVAYVEAMAGAVPAIGCEGEGGPVEIAAAGDGIRLVPPRNVAALADEIDRLLSDDDARRELGQAAHATVEREFTWPRCGEATVAAYAAALTRSTP